MSTCDNGSIRRIFNCSFLPSVCANGNLRQGRSEKFNFYNFVQRRSLQGLQANTEEKACGTWKNKYVSEIKGRINKGRLWPKSPEIRERQGVREGLGLGEQSLALSAETVGSMGILSLMKTKFLLWLIRIHIFKHLKIQGECEAWISWSCKSRDFFSFLVEVVFLLNKYKKISAV